MNNISKQTNLKLDTAFVPKTISDLLTEISMIRDFSLKTSKLDIHIRFLEDELRKIDVFKRELPQCMQLLNDVIELLKKERSRLMEIGKGPELVTEEFMPFRSDQRERGESSLQNCKDKKTWMSRVRLWNAPVQFQNSGNEAISLKSRGSTSFVPLKRAFSAMDHAKGEKKAPVEEILMSVPVEAIDLSNTDLKQQKKRRRCWSPELHKLFVDALMQLGGPNAATPRQIRDQMNVEGLTNDEVKSHLQKYRLHIRKLSAASTSGSPEDNLDEGGSAARGGDATTDEGDKSVSQD